MEKNLFKKRTKKKTLKIETFYYPSPDRVNKITSKCTTCFYICKNCLTNHMSN